MKCTITALALAGLLAACGTPEPVPAPDYDLPAVESTTTTRATTKEKDPQYDTCADAIAAGYGPYMRTDPEFAWYGDGDGDGVVCEQ
jgi:micrococcal nuclease